MNAWTKTVLYSLSSGTIVLITNFSTLATERQISQLSEISAVQWLILFGGAVLAVLNDLKAALTKSPVDHES